MALGYYLNKDFMLPHPLSQNCCWWVESLFLFYVLYTPYVCKRTHNFIFCFYIKAEFYSEEL